MESRETEDFQQPIDSGEPSQMEEIMQIDRALEISRQEYLTKLHQSESSGDAAVQQELLLEGKRGQLIERFPGIDLDILNRFLEISW